MRAMLFRIIIAIIAGIAMAGCEHEGSKDGTDTTPPVLELLGDNPITVVANHPCKDPGATAMDDHDGYVPIEVEGDINLSKAGTYRITYRATDSAGNTAEKVRVVHVMAENNDTTAPVITLEGDNPVTVYRGDPYTDAGARADDDIDGDITENIQRVNPVKTDTIGTYTVTYDVNDSAGNAAEQVTRTVQVVANPHVFRLRIRTDQASGESNSTQFVVPTVGKGYDYSIDCEDDGFYETIHETGNHTCDYPSAGTYTIVINGDFPRIYFNATGDANKVEAIEQWGSIPWTSMAHAFHGCAYMDIEASDMPDLSHATDLSSMFEDAKTLECADYDIGKWNTSQIKDFRSMFKNAENFAGDLEEWDTASAQYMDGMFEGADSMTGNSLYDHWDVGNVTSHNNFSDRTWRSNGNKEPQWPQKEQ